MTPVLKEFMFAMDGSVSRTVRLAEDTSTIKDQCTGIQEGDQEFQGPRDNTIYNMGVKDGVAGLADYLHEAGYAITDPSGNVVKTESAPLDGPVLTFSETYFTTDWFSNVSN